MQPLFNNFNLSKKRLIIILGFPLIIIIVSLTLLFFQSFNDKKITVIDLPEDIPKHTREEIESAVFSIAEKNKPANSDINLSIIKGKLRTNTLKTDYEKIHSIHSGTFIVDLEEIQQSYRIIYNYIGKETKDPDFRLDLSVKPYCLIKPDLVYPSFPCHNPFNANDTETAHEAILQALPYSITVNGSELHVETYDYADGTPYLEISMNSCGNKDLLDLGTKKVKTWIKDTLGLDPKSFSYEIRDKCDDGI